MRSSPFGRDALSGGAWVDLAQDVTRPGGSRQNAAQATSLCVYEAASLPGALWQNHLLRLRYCYPLQSQGALLGASACGHVPWILELEPRRARWENPLRTGARKIWPRLHQSRADAL